MAEVFVETNQVPIEGGYDVVVVGGGVAGVSAALAAQRSGCRTLLIEKSAMLGGLATLGLIAHYLPLCDGNGNKVVGGIAEELLYESIKYGYDDLPHDWRDGNAPASGARYMTVFSPPGFAIALDELVENEGITILLETLFCRPMMEGRQCRGVVVENKSGRKAYTGKAVIDTTGDADLMERAGAACVNGDNWLSVWAYTTDLRKMQGALAKEDAFHGIKLRKIGSHPSGKNAPAGFPTYGGTDAHEVTRYILDSRKLLREALFWDGKREKILLTLPGMAQLRTTRCIQGYYNLGSGDVFRRFDDSIGCTGDWRKPGPVYEIPYRTLISPQVDNIITAGRTIGVADNEGWEIARVIPPASMTGQAAGTAAALAARDGCALKDVPVRALQCTLEENGVILHYE